MSDQDPENFDDDFADIEVSDEDFVEDYDLPDDELLGVPEDDTELDYIEDDFMDDGWDEELYGTPDESLIAKEKKSYDTNKIAIGVALIAGLCVLGYQLYINRPEAVEHFKTALSMTGSTDGPIFGKENDKKEEPETLKIEKGFLDDPAVIDPDSAKVETAQEDGEENPPMPVPIAQDQPSGPADVLTPMPKVEGFVDAAEEDGAQVPRSPDDMLSTQNSDGENKAQALLEKTLAERNGEQSDETELAMNDGQDSAEDQSQDDTGFGFDNSLGFDESDPLLGESDNSASQTETEDKIITKIMPTSKEVPLAEESESEPQTAEAETNSDTISASAQAEIDALKEEIATLKAELEKSQQEAAAQKRIAEKAAEKAEASPPPQKQTAAAPAKKAAPQKAQTTQQATSSRWVLRAAQPGKAWVARAGQRDMQSVVVGDTLAGIGRVTEISYTNGRWVVQGTQGRINQ